MAAILFFSILLFFAEVQHEGGGGLGVIGHRQNDYDT
jgi:hypothetical protein